MASYNELLALIDAYINQNGVQAITGQVLNGVLRAMVDQLGRGYSIMGAADPTTDPGTPDGPETWFASVPGTYTNFDGIQIVDGELALLSYEPSTGFSKNTIYEGFQTVQATIDGNVGTPAVGVSYANGILSFDFHNMKGVTGDPAGFGAVTASVDSNIGTPSVQVQTSGPDTAKAIAFQFHNLKGETGVTSVLATVDNTSGNPQCAVSLQNGQLTLAFTGLKGAQGNTGSSVDYPFTIVNNLTTNDATQALSAAMGVQLESEVSQLEAEVNGGDESITGTETAGKVIGSNGAVSDNASFKIVTFPVTKDEVKVTVPSAATQSTPYYCFFADSTLATVKGSAARTNTLAGDTTTLTVPSGAGVLAISIVSASTPTVTERGEGIAQRVVALEGLSQSVADMEVEIDGENTTLTGITESGKYINGNGAKADDASFKIVGFDVTGYDKVSVQIPSAASQSTPFYCFFTSSDMSTKVGSSVRTNTLAGSTTEITVPTGATCLGISIVSWQDPTVKYIELGLKGRVESLETDVASLDGRLDDAEENIEEGKKIYGLVLESERTVNLFDRNFVEEGKYINNNGTISSVSGWAVSPMIPVTAGEKYLISCKTSGRDYGVSWYDANGDLISGGSTTIYDVHTAPSGAAFLRFNVASNSIYSTEVMVIHGETPVPYVPYNQITTDKVNGLDAFVRNVVNDGELSVEKNGNEITVNSGANYIKAKLENNTGNTYGANPVFDFTKLQYGSMISTNSDEIAPVHILRTTIGANHGQPCQLATVTGHGLGNTSIGTEWLDGNGVKFYIMRIVDADKLVFLSENTGTLSAPQFVALVAGTLTKGADTLTVTSVTATQLYPALKNHSVKLMVDGKDEISADGTYSAKFLDVVEEYGIMHPVSTLQKIIARAGESSDPNYDGDEAVRIKNIYRFCGNLCVLVIATVIPVQDVAFADIMFAQAAKMATDTIKYYIPNSLPLGGGSYDFRKPLSVNWSSSLPSLFVGTSQMADTDNPVNRVVQYDESKNVGFALGFVRGFGVAKDILDYTTETFELRKDSGKVYPHGVSYGKVGGTLHPGMIYQAVLYRSPFPFTSLSSGQMSMYHFPFDGAEYVFVDYASTVFDNVKVDSSLNGKTIEVIEAVNTELVTDIYNDGFLVNATYVEGETCYLVAKIK